MSDEENRTAEANETDEGPYIFGLRKSHKQLVARLASGIRTLLRRPNLSPRQICALAKLLHAVLRLPEDTDCFAVELSLNNEFSYCSIAFDEENFDLTSGEIIDTGIGHDHQEGVGFYAEWEGKCKGNFEGWLEEFERRVADVEYELHVSEDREDFSWDGEEDGVYYVAEELWEKMK